jgi:hypothetical protein
MEEAMKELEEEEKKGPKRKSRVSTSKNKTKKMVR